jgi:drug/metabolite transporter (DMT)-like permease
MNDSPAAPETGNDFFNYFCLVSLSFCLGTTFILQIFALQDMSPLMAGTLRLAFCAAALVPAAFIAGHNLPTTRTLWLWATFNGLIGFYLPFNLTANGWALCWEQQVWSCWHFPMAWRVRLLTATCLPNW